MGPLFSFHCWFCKEVLEGNFGTKGSTVGCIVMAHQFDCNRLRSK